jgi:hypothetical protein
MAKKSPLRSAQPDTLSVCGKLLRKGQSVTVTESAIGPRERTMLARKQLGKRKSNKPGHVQLVVL